MLSDKERIEQLEKKVEFLAKMLCEHHHGYPNDSHTVIRNDDTAVISKYYTGWDNLPACSVDTIAYLLKEFEHDNNLDFTCARTNTRSNT